jgi:hypothetical protein
MFTFAVLVFVLLVVAFITFKARGDGRSDLRRCPRCSYDLSGTSALLCPECGHQATSESELHHRGGSTPVFRAGVTTICVLLIIGVYTAIPGPWTSNLPRPIMRAALFIAATPPDPPKVNAGWLLPVPNIALLNSKSPWDRLVWQHQASIVFDMWATAVLATQGPITDDELARLVPLVDQVSGIWSQTGALPADEAWNIHSTHKRLASARLEAQGDPHRTLRIEWALATLQYFGRGYSLRPDYALIPDAIILQALVHTDSRVREFGINSVGRRADDVFIDPITPMVNARQKVIELAQTDPQPSVRKQAADMVSYLESIIPQR